MTKARQSIELPIQPLCVSREVAAMLCDLSPNVFDDWVDAGMLPKPIEHRGRKIWYIKALEVRLDELAGLSAHAPDEEALRRVKRWRQSRSAT